MVVCDLGPAEREEKVKESLEIAKEAVSLDVKDGMSWSECWPLYCISPMLHACSDSGERIPLYVLHDRTRPQGSQTMHLGIHPSC